jgi:serine/threonine protein kinase
MSMLQVRATADYSVARSKAMDDAKKMQAAVEEESARSGKESPPYRLTELIGKGSFGRVYKALDRKTNMLVAVKIIDIEESDTLNPKLADTYSEIMKEINALKLLSDGGAKNINNVIEALPVGQSMWMITEYCAGGSVATLMKPTAPRGLHEEWIIPILREVAEAIYWVHKQGIIHRDIKCANVLVTEIGAVQLCDFGVAGVIETRFDKRSTFIGTPHWMAPELFEQSKSYGTEVDIWAFGSMVYEIASGLPPNARAVTDIYQLGNHLKQHTPRLEGNYSVDLKNLVSYCLVEDPSRRPPIEMIQQHPYIAGTSADYPTSSLANLVKGYRLWEAQGGSRLSLFAPVGAQGLSDLSSTALAADEWNFSTTAAFDENVFQNTDAQAVYDVYGPKVDFNPEFQDATPRPSKLKGRRRPPPQLAAALRAPLEKVFDPNTISNYEDNSRAYYGKPLPPPTSDLPLRDDSQQSSVVRESLIDLDASLHGSELSRFVDMATLRGGGQRPSVDYSLDDGTDYNKPPLSDPADLTNNRRTQDWKFPSMAPPASANPEMSRFPFNEPDRNAFTPNSMDRPLLMHHSPDPAPLQSYGNDLMIPRTTNQANRVSAGSLIDLDMSMPDPVTDTRPSTANSDVASVSGSDFGMANPFDLERHASLYVPSSNREPSIYVSDSSDFGLQLNRNDDVEGMIDLTLNERNGRGYSTDTQSYSGNEYSDNEYPAVQPRSQPSLSSTQRSYQQPLPLPPTPNPPSERVMQGQTSGEAVKEELRRLAMSLGEHLSHANHYLSTLPVRRAPGRQDYAGELSQ